MRFVFSEKLFELVSNMKISRFIMIIYNSRNWESLSTLISPDAIIFSRALTCSIIFHIASCRFPVGFSLGSLDGFILGTYDGTELGSPYGSNEGTTYVKLEGLLLYAWLGYIYGLELGISVGNELGLSDGRVLGTTLGSLDGLSLGTYDGTVLSFLELSNEVIVEVNLEGLLLCDWLGFLGGLKIGIDDDNALWLWDGEPLGTTLVDLYGLSLGTYGGTELGCSEDST